MREIVVNDEIVIKCSKQKILVQRWKWGQWCVWGLTPVEIGIAVFLISKSGCW